MEKILFISNIAKKIGSFSVASIEAAQDCGMQFHMAANWEAASTEQIISDQKQYNVKIHNIPLSRIPYSPVNIKAYKELASIIKNEGIDYIHCNTPTGGMLGRLVGKRYKVKKVIYQAHGFHFYKGAPIKNWILYYTVEKWLAHYTDAIITINKEDYEAAKKFKLRKDGKVYYVPGVGIDTKMYKNVEVDRKALRTSLGFKDTDVICISMGDLIERKNYPVAIKAIAKCKNPNLHYIICGQGPERDNLEKLVLEQGVKEQVHFLGFRTDIKELLKAADIFLFTTLQEGMPRSMMEAMASGLPCVASKIRGNVDLLEEGKGGYLLETDDISGIAEKVNKLSKDAELRKQMSKKNLLRILDFDIDKVKKDITEIYKKELGN